MRGVRGEPKETISVALAENEGAREVRSHGTMSHDLHALEKLLRKLQGEGPERRELRVCYEAGPCGFGVARRLLQLKIDCQVIAPSLIPQKSGDRQKNDRGGGRDKGGRGAGEPNAMRSSWRACTARAS